MSAYILGLGPDEVYGHGLRTPPSRFEHFFHRRRLGRFSENEENLRRRIFAKSFNRLNHGEAADRVRDVTSSGAEGARYSASCSVDGGHRLLNPRSRRARDPDFSRPHDVAKPEADASDVRRSAVRTHHQQTLLAAYALERHLVFDGHVVTEDEAVEAFSERALRLAPHAWTGNREEGQIDERVFAERRVKRRCGEVRERSRSTARAGRS